MPEPSCWSRPEPCELDKQAEGRRDRMLLILELRRKGTLLLVLGILPPCDREYDQLKHTLHHRLRGPRCKKI
jgi:hypothetical protein